MSVNPPVFICGNDRSGTTMLRVVMDRGDVSIPMPSFFLMDFAHVRAGSRDLSDRSEARAFLREIWEHPKVRRWGLEAPPPEPPEGLDHEAAYRWCAEAPFLAFMRQEGKSRWGDKTAPYVFIIDELLALWPDAHVVVLERDGRDVALSVFNVPFGANNAWAAARDWKRGIEAGRAAAARWPRQVKLVRYEDLVTEPATTMPGVCEFAGIPYDEDMLRIEQTAPDRVDRKQGTWHDNVFSGINTRSVAKWRDRMTTRQLAAFHSVAGDTLRELGYEVPDAGRAPGAIGRLGYRLHDRLTRLGNFLRHRLLREKGREVRFVVSRRVRKV